MNRISITALFLLWSLVCLRNVLYSQDTSIIPEGSLIDLEMKKIQEDFSKTGTQGTSIPQSKLLEELNKPGNESLLEQLKNINGKSQEMLELEVKSLKENIEQLKEKTGEDNKTDLVEDEDEKLKIASTSEIYFDMVKYFESIKDFYGYKIFIQNAEEDLKPKEELYPARNSGHIISPGDSFVLTVWGDAEFQRRLQVSGEGTVFVENVGIISVHGLTVEEFENKLKKVLSRKYKTIEPENGNPTTFFDVSFEKFTVMNVFVTGEVVMPGPYSLSPKSTIISALIKARGVTAKGTLRNINLIRDGKVIKVFDIYDYLQTGKDVNDILLRNNDNIFVGTRLNTVELKGEVINPLKYELKADETLSDLIKYSGGLLTSAASDKISIERIVPIQERTSPVVYSKILDYDFTFINDSTVKVNPLKLYDRDIITVHTIPRILTEYVSVEGAVYRKGRYSFTNGMTLHDLIIKSGGLLADAYTDKIELIRTQADQKKEYKSLNITGEKDYKFVLSNLDSVRIHSKWDLHSKKIVIINGYIKNPGFEYLADSTRISDLIFSRGGILDEWRRNRTYLLRAELTRYNIDGVTTRIINLNLEKILNGDEKEDLFLQDGDQLRIYDLYMIYNEGKVNISGYVKNEGEYRLSENMTVEDLILKAHGFREGAFEYKAIVFRMNNSEKDNSLSVVHEVRLSKDYFKHDNIPKSEFYLQDNDHVVIRKDPYYRTLRKITLTGEVKFPGLYSLISHEEKLRDIIERAGGLTDEAYIDGIDFYRDTTRLVSNFYKAINGNRKFDITIKDGDNIFIPKHPGTVSVEGFVYTPGLIKFNKDWSINDYIEAAGGKIVELDFKAGAPVIYYPGGDAKVDKKWFYTPYVKEGSRIVVPKIKRESDREWRTEIRNWMGVFTSALTIVLLYQAANR